MQDFVPTEKQFWEDCSRSWATGLHPTIAIINQSEEIGQRRMLQKYGFKVLLIDEWGTSKHCPICLQNPW